MATVKRYQSWQTKNTDVDDTQNIIDTYLNSVSEEERTKINDTIASIDNLIKLEESKVETLKQLRKGLIQQLIPGRGEKEPQRRFPEFRDKNK
jgi:type I restriction enzyme, S subunit